MHTHTWPFSTSPTRKGPIPWEAHIAIWKIPRSIRWPVSLHLPQLSLPHLSYGHHPSHTTCVIVAAIRSSLLYVGNLSLTHWGLKKMGDTLHTDFRMNFPESRCLNYTCQDKVSLQCIPACPIISWSALGHIYIHQIYATNYYQVQ